MLLEEVTLPTRDSNAPTKEDVEHVLANLVSFFKDGMRNPYNTFPGYKSGQAIPMKSAEQSGTTFPAMIEVVIIIKGSTRYRGCQQIRIHSRESK